MYILRLKSSSSFQMKCLKFLRKKSEYKYNCENLKNAIWKIVWYISFSRSFSFSNSFVGRFENRSQDIPILPISWFWINNGIYFWAKAFRFHIESWPEWDSDPQPRAYCTHPLTTELSGQTIRCASWSTGSNDHEAQVIARWLQWASLNHIRS